MKAVEFRYLSQEDVMALRLPLADVTAAVESALVEHAHKTIEMPPKPGVHPTYENTFIHAMPAYLKTMDACGLKWVAGFPRNYERGLPNVSGLIVLNDTQTGIPLAVMDCRWVTTVRTAAVSAIAARCCCAADPQVLAILGAGLQGRYHAWTITQALPSIREVRYFDVLPQSQASFAAWTPSRFAGRLVAAADPESCVRGADVIATCTPGDKPLVEDEWFQPGAVGIGIEGTCAWATGIARNVEKFIVDDIAQAQYFEKQGDFPGGLPPVYAELGEIVAGIKPGRETPQERVLAAPLGLAIEDIALARLIYQRAVAAGAGRMLPLMRDEL